MPQLTLATFETTTWPEWWAQLAHRQFIPINIEPKFLRDWLEELMNVRGIGEKSFLKLRSLVTVTPPRAKSVGSGALAA